jgi:hypothetical protein
MTPPDDGLPGTGRNSLRGVTGTRRHRGKYGFPFINRLFFEN